MAVAVAAVLRACHAVTDMAYFAARGTAAAAHLHRAEIAFARFR